MWFAPSRADLEALPRALGLVAAAAEVAGDRAGADAALEASRRLGELPTAGRRDVVRRARRGEAAAGWSAAAAEVARRVLDEGPSATEEAELAKLPADLAALLLADDLDPLDVVAAHRRHGVVTGADIAAVVATASPSPDEDHAALLRLAERLPWLRQHRRRVPLGRAFAILERCQAALSSAGIASVDPLGSVRRFEPTVGDLELLIVEEDPGAALARAVETLGPDHVRHRGPTRGVLTLERQEVGLRAALPREAALLSLWHTGTAAHVRALHRRAAARELGLRPHALVDASGRSLPCATEADVYAHLDLPWIAPELRHGEDEIARAAEGTLPRLVEAADIRGDLHTHTLWSDGRDSVESIVRAARALRYEYVAITDHSPSAAASRVLSLDRLAQQAEDVARVRAEVPGITVLHGVEVDILADGALDLPDDVLAGLDVVLASLHESHGHSPARLLDRYARAMRHPLVHIVTHPANRMPGRSDGYPLDFDALFSVAVETGTVLEIDGGPGHLDLDGHLARRAVDAGVLLSIDSDSHDAGRLGRQMRMGVGTARRGGVTAAQVLNTRPLAEVRALLGKKREGWR